MQGVFQIIKLDYFGVLCYNGKRWEHFKKEGEMDYLMYLEEIKSSELAQDEQLQLAKDIFKTNEWQMYRDEAAEDLERRRTLNKTLKETRNKVFEAIDLLWKDTLISFAREIHYDKRMRDLSEEKIAEIEKQRVAKKKKQLQNGVLALVVPAFIALTGLGLAYLMKSITFLSAVFFGGGISIGFLAFGEGIRTILASRKDDPNWIPIAYLQKVVETMSIVRKTKPYEAILELEEFCDTIADEIEKVSWPPVYWAYDNSSTIV